MSNIKFKITPPLGSAPSNPLREAREQLERAETFRQQRQFDRAESICSALVRKYPDYFGALHTFGLLCADKGDYRRALGLLVSAAMINPKSWITLTALSGVYLRLGAKEMAARTLEQARTLKPNDASVLITLAEIYREEREYELARDAFREALAIEPTNEAAALGVGQTSASLGEYAQAAAAYQELLRRGVRRIAILSGVVALPLGSVSIDLLAELDKVAPRPDDDKARFARIVAFVRAAALDKSGKAHEAWQQADAANRVIAPKMKEELSQETLRQAATLEWLRSPAVTARARISDSEKLPISLFILGPSRSGKTTVEALVSTLEGVKRGYENPALELAICRAYQEAGLLTTFTLEHLPPQFYPNVRDFYAEEITRRAQSARVFTNTHPAYIYQAPRLPGILPNTRFIFVKREIDDTVLRMYFRDYEEGNAYSYDVKTAREHVSRYYEIMDAMAERFPDIVRVLRYEDVVRDPATAVRAAADLCGLSPSDKPLPPIGDDRGCAKPYQQFIQVELSA